MYPTLTPSGGVNAVVAPASPLSTTQIVGIGSATLLVPLTISKLAFCSRFPVQNAGDGVGVGALVGVLVGVLVRVFVSVGVVVGLVGVVVGVLVGVRVGVLVDPVGVR